MKKTNLFLYAATLFVCFSISHVASAQTCNAIAQIPLEFATAGKWRVDSTNPDEKGQFTPTTKDREKDIQAYVKESENDVLKDHSTPLMEFFEDPTVSLDEMVETQGYGTHTVERYKVTGLGPDGILKGTLGLSVSGHAGSTPEEKTANAKKWAKTDTYSVLRWDTDGKYDYGGTAATALIQNAKSLNLVTLQEVAIPLVKDKVISVTYERSGSAGHGGYIEGRAVEFVWDGK